MIIHQIAKTVALVAEQLVVPVVLLELNKQIMYKKNLLDTEVVETKNKVAKVMIRHVLHKWVDYFTVVVKVVLDIMVVVVVEVLTQVVTLLNMPVVPVVVEVLITDTHK